MKINNMKNFNVRNLFAVCLIAMFVISLIPLAFADDNASVRASATASANSGNPRKDLNEIRAAEKDQRDKMKDERQNFQQERKEDMQQMKENRQNFMQQRNESMQQIKEARQNFRQERNETMQKLKDEKEKLFQQRKDFMEKMKENTQERISILKEAQEAKRSGKANETVEKYKDFVSKTAGQWINELNDLKSKVQESKELSDQQKADITATIDAKIANITSLKVQIDASTTKDQLKDYTKQLRELKTDSFQRLFNLRVLSARIQGYTNRASEMQKRLDAISQRAKAKNVDISAEVSAFNTKIKDSSDKNAQAQLDISQVISLMKTAGNDAQAKSLMDNARDALKGATDSLKQAQETLKSIVGKLGAAGKSDVLAQASGSANATASS